MPETHFRVIAADDHPVVLSGIRLVLRGSGDFTLLAETEDGTTTLAAIERSVPDLLILDLWMGENDGIELLRQIHGRWPSIRVLVYLRALGLVVLMSLVFVGQAISGMHFARMFPSWPKTYMAIPLVLWISYRFGRRGAVVGVMLLMITGVAGTVRGYAVFLDLEQTSGEVIISITDEGPGIPERDRMVIFSGKARSGRAVPTGGESSSGMGLYLTG